MIYLKRKLSIPQLSKQINTQRGLIQLMSLNLKEAALLAQLSPEDLIIEINKGSLVAEEAEDQAEDVYKIEEYDLDAFIKKKSFDALWTKSENGEEEFENEPRGSSIAGNLRRVLTAEAVSELKIQHQVLIARVQTLERLFSEFMDAEKHAENMLVLEDEWKISNEAEDVQASRPATPPLENSSSVSMKLDTASPSEDTKSGFKDEVSAADVEPLGDVIFEDQVDASNSSSIQSNHEARRAYQLQTAEAEKESRKNKSNELASKVTEEQEAPLKEVEDQSSKDLLTKKLKLMKAEKTNLEKEGVDDTVGTVEAKIVNKHDHSQENEGADGGIGIAERLQEYERRLATAKQTATQMWH